MSGLRDEIIGATIHRLHQENLQDRRRHPLENWGLLDVLQPTRRFLTAQLGQLPIQHHQVVHLLPELVILHIGGGGENPLGSLVGLNQDMTVELGGVQSHRLIKEGPLVIVKVHGDVDRQAEEPRPQLRLPIIEELGIGLEHGGKEVAMAVLVLAPVLKVFEEREDLKLRAPL